MRVQKAIFPVAGLGTRFLPATKAQPKEMLPVVDKPLIQYAVEEAYAAGVREMIFVTGRHKRPIEDHFDMTYELEVALERAEKHELLEVVRPATASAVADAEFTIGALLQMFRRVPIANDEGLLVGRELGSAVVGLVGMTSTAKPLAQLLRAFGARVVGYDPGLHASDPVWERTGVEPIALSELMQTSDAVCVLLGYFARFAGLFGERLLGECKANQVLVSLGHSSLFDESALARALLSGQMSAAWFDSMEPGLLDPGRPLRRIDTLQVTPRVAGTTQQSRTRSAWAVARRIDELLFTVPVPVVFKPALQTDDFSGLAGDPVLV